jgi:hypothetical protein
VAKQASYNAKRQIRSMQTNIVCSLMGQTTRLQARLWKQQRGNSLHEPSLVLKYKLLKTVCHMVWDVHLLKTSVLVTKTPLTTLKCLSRKYIGRKHPSYALINSVEERMLRAVKDITTDLFMGTKQFVCALIGRLD